MCIFIMIGVPRDRVTELKDLVPRGFLLQGLTNKYLCRELPTDFRTIAITEGPCSCSLFVNPPDEDEVETTPEKYAEAVRAKFMKRGWSESKVERAIRQAVAHFKPPNEFVGLRSDVRNLLANIAEHFGQITIFVNMYSGDVRTEKVKILQRIRVTSEVLRVGSTQVTENGLIEVVGRTR